MLVGTRENTPHPDDFGYPAEQRAHRDRSCKADRDGQAQSRDEPGAEDSTEHAEMTGRDAQDLRSRVHHVVGECRRCVDSTDRKAGYDDRKHAAFPAVDRWSTLSAGPPRSCRP